MKKVLVTGGLGYIGSHTVVALQMNGYETLIIDDLSNSKIEVLDGIERITSIRPAFERIDLREQSKVEKWFHRHPDLDSIIHFAASKSVGESVSKPLHYYQNNLAPVWNILGSIKDEKTFHFIFSSSCTVYGDAEEMPVKENAPVKPASSPYGNTKQIGEEILSDFSRIHEGFNVIFLRYFNPIGSHPSAEIGELSIGTPQNLVPFITQTAAGLRDKLRVFGKDYPTLDGTCVRDYIYIMDLAEAHVKTLERLRHKQNTDRVEIFNVGTGKGSSVLEVIKGFENLSGKKLCYEFAGRREGDVAVAYADTAKAANILEWKSKYDLNYALNTAWKWQKKISKKPI